MKPKKFKSASSAALFCVLLLVCAPHSNSSFAQDEEAETTETSDTETNDTPATTAADDEPFDEGLFPELPAPGEEAETPVATGDEQREGEAPQTIRPAAPKSGTAQGEKIEGGEAREGETRWFVTITGAVILNYTFSDTQQGFQIKYRWEVKGQANAETAVIKGDSTIVAEVEGPLLRWPSGECHLDITIPKVPFELTFQRADDEKGNLRLNFKHAINEDWESRCSFTDAPDRRFDTRGAPEEWLAKAIEKTKPPLDEIIAEMGKEETSTRFIIAKETIPDPPVGTVEIEGAGVVTIKPGGE